MIYFMDTLNKTCLTCGKELQGRQVKYCSHVCRCRYINFSVHGSRGYQSYLCQKLRGNKRKREFIELKGGKCMKCGYSKSLRALSFHHRRDSLPKEFSLDVRHLSNRTYESCLRELDKCDLLCANCHMELHEGEESAKTEQELLLNPIDVTKWCEN